MKKHRRMLFILSLAAQFISACGAAAMLFKKKRGMAGLFAALGLFGVVLAGSVLKTVPDKTEKNVKKACDILQNDIRDAQNGNSYDDFADDNVQSFSDAVDEAFSSMGDGGEFYREEEDIGNKTKDPDVQQNERSELWRIERAINILKDAGAENDEGFGDIDAQINGELSKL